MGNQAQQRQELELWQVVSPPNYNKNKPYRASRPRNRNMQSGPKPIMQGSRSQQRIEDVSSADPIRMIPTNAASTRSNASRGRTSAVARPNVSRTNVGRTVSPAMPRTGTGRRTEAKKYRTNIPEARRVRTEYAEPGRRRTTPAKAGRRARINQCLAILWIAAMSAAIFFMGKAFYQSTQKHPITEQEVAIKSPLETVPVEEDTKKKPKILEDFLTISEYNRPGTRLERVDNIFVHYTANPGTSAAQNRSYFESLGQTHERAASAHFIIGYEGEIIQCIPLEEEAYAVIERNVDSISIECCYIAEDGSFTQATYDSLIEMLAWLTDKYNLKPQDILRHYDCGGKKCPKYYVEHEDAWQQLLDDVEHYIL